MVETNENATGAQRQKQGISEADLQRLLECISQIEYGSVTVVIQDGYVLQIEKHEKIRLK